MEPGVLMQHRGQGRGLMQCAAGGSGDVAQHKRRGTLHEEMGVSKGKMTKIKNLHEL